MWRSLVAHLNGVQGAGCSNHLIPTMKDKGLRITTRKPFSFVLCWPYPAAILTTFLPSKIGMVSPKFRPPNSMENAVNWIAIRN